MTQLTTTRNEAVLTVRLDNPPHNLIPPDLIQQLHQLLCDAEKDSRIRGVVFAGTPDGRWFTHMDPGEIARQLEGPSLKLSFRRALFVARLLGWLRKAPRLERRLRRSPLGGAITSHLLDETYELIRSSEKVYVAAVNGVSFGFGFILALACDYRLAAERGVLFGLPEPVLGFLPSGVPVALTRLAGPATAFELLAEGKMMTPDQARQRGLIHRVVPGQELQTEAEALVTRVARRPPGVVREIKRLVHYGASLERDLSRRLEFASFASTIGRPPALAGLRQLDRDLEGTSNPAELVAAWQEAEQRDLSG